MLSTLGVVERDKQTSKSELDENHKLKSIRNFLSLSTNYMSTASLMIAFKMTLKLIYTFQ